MKQTGAQIIVKLLEMYGIETVAGIPGGMILPLYDELNKSKIRHVLVRHEQAAGLLHRDLRVLQVMLLFVWQQVGLVQ